MKVKALKDNYINGCLSKGKIYDVIKLDINFLKNKKYYMIVDNEGFLMWVDEKEVEEVKEEQEN